MEKKRSRQDLALFCDRFVYSPLSKRVRRKLACTRCGDLLIGEVFACGFNHMHCGECGYQGSMCANAFCAGPGVVREEGILVHLCLKVMHLVRTCQIKCLYANEGCSSTRNAEVYRNHLNQCIFRPLNCPYDIEQECTGLVRPSQVLHHIAVCHGISTVENHEADFQVPFIWKNPVKMKICKPIGCLRAFGKEYQVNVYPSCEVRTGFIVPNMHIWVTSLMATNKKPDWFKMTLGVRLNGVQIPATEVTGPVINLRADIREGGPGLILTIPPSRKSRVDHKDVIIKITIVDGGITAMSF